MYSKRVPILRPWSDHVDLPNNADKRLLQQARALVDAVNKYVADQAEEWHALHALMGRLRAENHRTRGDANAIWLRPDHFSGLKYWLPLDEDGEAAVAILLMSARLAQPYEARRRPRHEHIVWLALHPELITASWHRAQILEFAGLTEADLAAVPA